MEIVGFEIDNKYIDNIDTGYADLKSVHGNKCQTKEDAEALKAALEGADDVECIKADNGRWFCRTTVEGFIMYYTVMDNGITSCISMSKEGKGGYEVPVTEEAIAIADDIIKTYQDNGMYLEYGKLLQKESNRGACAFLLLGLAVLLLYVAAEKLRGREKSSQPGPRPKPETQNSKMAMDAFISEAEAEGISVLTVAGYYGRMSSVKAFGGSLGEKAASCIEYIDSDLIKEGKTADGSVRVNYSSELLKSLVVSGLAASDEGKLFIRASETELVLAVPCEKTDIKESAAKELYEAGYDVYSLSDIAEAAKKIVTEYDEEKKLYYVTVPIDTYFEISEEMRSRLNIASRGGHHHAFS